MYLLAEKNFNISAENYNNDNGNDLLASNAPSTYDNGLFYCC